MASSVNLLVMSRPPSHVAGPPKPHANRRVRRRDNPRVVCVRRGPGGASTRARIAGGRLHPTLLPRDLYRSRPSTLSTPCARTGTPAHSTGRRRVRAGFERSCSAKASAGTIGQRAGQGRGALLPRSDPATARAGPDAWDTRPVGRRLSSGGERVAQGVWPDLVADGEAC